MKSEARNFPRKILRGPAEVVLLGMQRLRARTIEISHGGLALSVPEQLPIGQICTIAFDAPLNGKIVRVTGTAKVIYAILTGTEGFRTGVQFVQLDAENNKILADLMS